MGSRKRNHSEVIPVSEQEVPEQNGLLSKLRNSWDFASLMQYIAIFGQVMKIDEDFGIEVCTPIYLEWNQYFALYGVGEIYSKHFSG